MSALSTIFKALSDESRLRIYGLIVNSGELCVCDIETALRFSQTKVSRHLAVLRRAGLVQHRRQGLWVLYSAVRPRERESRAMLEAFGDVIRSNPVLQADARTLRRIIKHGTCATTAVLKSEMLPARMQHP